MSRLYAADLIGAALGCLAVFGLLEVVDGVSAVFFVALVAALAGFALIPRSSASLRRLARRASSR